MPHVLAPELEAGPRARAAVPPRAGRAVPRRLCFLTAPCGLRKERGPAGLDVSPEWPPEV